ncbi:hypothetical protein SBF1_790001 [Candidatus Desulfosporosinus infrequens]|uniref:Uncharacterized protein n=1 Tax=Candidatus Desulfosporosinus infrequens TaxID=2043169 RepID=A0A2U3LS51_9FIRM|nr:hypothetical protein SBF1_790001 [Candidatus Desulfosporosinus infrequens]
MISNCLIIYNVFALTRVLHDYTQVRKSFNEEVLYDLSPYRWLCSNGTETAI